MPRQQSHARTTGRTDHRAHSPQMAIHACACSILHGNHHTRSNLRPDAANTYQSPKLRTHNQSQQVTQLRARQTAFRAMHKPTPLQTPMPHTTLHISIIMHHGASHPCRTNSMATQRKRVCQQKKSRQVLDVLYVATKAGQRGASSTVCMLLGGSPQYGGVPTQQVMRSAARRRTLWRRTCNESGRAFRETAKGCLHENRRCQRGGAL